MGGTVHMVNVFTAGVTEPNNRGHKIPPKEEIRVQTRAGAAGRDHGQGEGS